MNKLVTLALVSLLAACSDAPSPDSAKASELATQVKPGSTEHELGRKIYNFRCYFCHGYSGDSKTLASTYLSPRPRDFQSTAIEDISLPDMLTTVTKGRAGTAMAGFEGILEPAEILAVTNFVRQEFMLSKAPNTRYHTVANGWPNHERYAAAFPFATGELAIDTPAEKMTGQQRAGKRLFMASCVSCHDRSKVNDAGAPWELRPLSYPRNGFSPGDWPQVDGITSATPYHKHDIIPKLANLTPQEKRGEALYQFNCAFCHAADGTGRNWIGSFLEPHPRDLTQSAFMSTMTRERLTAVIEEGLPDTSMPAWKSVLSKTEIQDVIAYVSRAFHPLDKSQPK